MDLHDLSFGETMSSGPTPGTHGFLERDAWGRLAGWCWGDPSRPGKVEGAGGWGLTPGSPTSGCMTLTSRSASLPLRFPLCMGG